MPGQKPKAVEHDRAKETVKMDDRHLAWQEEWCGVFLFKSSLWKVLGKDPQKRVQDSFNWPGYRVLPQQLVQENLLSQVQAEPGRNEE